MRIFFVIFLLLWALPVSAQFPDTVWVNIEGESTFSGPDISRCVADVWVEEIADPEMVEVTPDAGTGISVEFTAISISGAGITQIEMRWTCQEEEVFGGVNSQLIQIRVTPNVVNSQGDESNNKAKEGHCDTGGVVMRDDKPEPACTLRAFIEKTNEGPGSEVITFDIPDIESKNIVINIEKQLPEIEKEVAIIGDDTNRLTIVDGVETDSDVSGFIVGKGASGTLIESLFIGGFANHGIEVYADSVTLKNNFVIANKGSGFFLSEANHTRIEVDNTNREYLIGNNRRYGIESEKSNHLKVIGYRIGMEPDEEDFPRLNHRGGIFINEGENNEIGGLTDEPGKAPGNIIGVNGPEGGIILRGNKTKVRGNIIGAKPDTVQNNNKPFPGNLGPGVFIEGSENIIGGTDQNTRNIIAGNDSTGVIVNGNESSSNTIRRNSIYRNRGLAIDLGADGPTANDLGDGRPTTYDRNQGPNNLLNYPVAITATPDPDDDDLVIISGILETQNPDDAIIELYSSENPGAFEPADGSHTRWGDGQVFIDSIQPTATGYIRHRVQANNIPHPILSATATDNNGNTSEFSWVCYDTTGDGNVDSDGDGICDNWEAHGIDYNGDGTVDFNLPQANPRKKNIYVEADYMAGHEPVWGHLANTVRAFARAPAASVNNPDESDGIILHIERGEEVPLVNPMSFIGPNSDFAAIKIGDRPCGAGNNVGRFGTSADRQAGNCAALIGARRLIFRYAVFGENHSHQIGSSGMGELSGNNFIVTIGSWSNNELVVSAGMGGPAAANVNLVLQSRGLVEKATFMHELGHTLGLEHGGSDDINCKPNYPSVMSYSLQMRDLVNARPLDYSRTEINVLDKSALDEQEGLQGPNNRLALARLGVADPNPGPNCTPGQLCVMPTNQSPVDWNADGFFNANPVASNINRISLAAAWCNGAGGDVLTGQNDWAVLNYNFRAFNDFSQGAAPHIDPDRSFERTIDEIMELAQEFDYSGDGIPNAFDNCPPMYNPDQTDTSGNGIGDACEGPFADVAVDMSAELNDPSVAFQITVFNFGPEDATDIVLTDTLSSDLEFREETSPLADCSINGQVFRCSIDHLAADDSTHITLTADVISGAETIENIAHVSYTYDPNPHNNRANVLLEEEVTGIDREDQGELPEEFRLYQNFPNPFNALTTIPFDVAEQAHVNLTIYNMMGRKIAVLVDEPRAAGSYETRFTAAGLSSGIYLYKIEMGSFQDVKKLILLK